jgi:tricorn protease
LRRLATTSLLALSLAAPLAAQTTNSLGFARDPHYFNGKVIFSFRGDIWQVNEDGSNAKQLTRLGSRDVKPRFSPDGQSIAFTSSREGNPDVFTMPAAGGEPKRLTWHTANDDVQYWTPDGKRILFSSSRGPMAWDSPLYTVGVEGDLPTAIEMGSGAAGMYSQDGALLAFNRTRYPDPKRHYRGSNNADVWVMNVRNNAFTQLTDLKLEDYKNAVHDANPMFGADGMIYFASERDGIFNIWKISPRGGNATQVTKHARGGVRFPSISPDGRTITYSNEFDLWVLPIAGSPKRIPVDLGYVIDRRLTEVRSTENTADGFGPSPNGSYMAVDHRGEIFVVPTDTGVGERRRVTESEWRQRDPMYSPNGQQLAYISDESQEEEIWVVTLSASERRKLTTQASKKTLLRWTTDGKQILFSSANSLFAVDVATAKTTEIAKWAAGGYTLNHASPDGKWLMLSRRDDYQNAEVALYDVTAKKEYNVTNHLARESNGMLSPDGKTVYFISNRDGGVNHLFSAPLAALTEDPDDPLVRERRAPAGGRGAGGGGRGAGGGGGGGAEAPYVAPVPAEIDVRDIHRRAVQLTRGAEGVSNPFLSADGRTIYFISGGGAGAAGGRGGGGRGGRGGAAPAAAPTQGGTGPGLFAVNVDGSNRRRVADGSFQGYQLTADGRTLFFTENNGISKMALTGGAKTPVRFALTFAVDKRAEWRQMFDEFYRYWKYNYVEEDMHGFDWAAIRKRYEVLVDKIGQTDDFYMLGNEMLNELNSSHSGITAPAEDEGGAPAGGGGRGGRGGGAGGAGAIPPNRTQFIGMELKPDARGLRVGYIYKDGPADKAWFNVKVGEYVTAINGTRVGAKDNYWKLLTGPLNEWVTVSVAAAPDAPQAQARDLRIRTIASMTDLKYTDWVARNRAYVDSVSGGKIAYFHMRGMNQPVLDQLKQEIDQYFYKQGMILDVRYNGGGNIDQELMDVLLRRPYEYTWTKTGSPMWGRRPQQLIAGPQVMMTNWRSNSNAEMVPHAFKQLGLGTVVGTPTNGAVVSAPNYPFLDGGSVRIPGTRVVSYDPSKPNNHGYNLENYGVPPNIFVKSSPDDEIKGLDRELLTAVQEALRLLAGGKWQQVQN